MTTDKHSLIDHFSPRRQLIVEEMAELVEVESPSNDIERSRRIVDLLVAKFSDAIPGVDVERISTAVGDHLVIDAFSSNEPHVLLLGHTDTVHPIGSNSANPTRSEDGRLYGCGIFDMKAGIVLMLEALRYFSSTGERPSRPIRIFLSCDEEVGSHTGREIVQREAIGASHCLVFEPSANGRCKTGRKGTGMYRIHAQGLPAHAGLEPEKGASSILEIATQVGALHSHNDLSAGISVNVCTISGGTATNVIPEHCEASVDVRFVSMSEADRIDATIRSLRPRDERVALTVAGGINRPPMERTEAVVKLFERSRELASAIGYDLGETQVGGASDGNFVSALGVPVLDGLGVRGDGAHMLTEYIEIDDIVARAALTVLLLKGL
jgi:glutamate carboxypeptidase